MTLFFASKTPAPSEWQSLRNCRQWCPIRCLSSSAGTACRLILSRLSLAECSISSFPGLRRRLDAAAAASAVVHEMKHAREYGRPTPCCRRELRRPPGFRRHLPSQLVHARQVLSARMRPLSHPALAVGRVAVHDVHEPRRHRARLHGRVVRAQGTASYFTDRRASVEEVHVVLHVSGLKTQPEKLTGLVRGGRREARLHRGRRRPPRGRPPRTCAGR